MSVTWRWKKKSPHLYNWREAFVCSTNSVKTYGTLVNSRLSWLLFSRVEKVNFRLGCLFFLTSEVNRIIDNANTTTQTSSPKARRLLFVFLRCITSVAVNTYSQKMYRVSYFDVFCAFLRITFLFTKLNTWGFYVRILLWEGK